MSSLKILGYWSLGESGLLLCWGFIAYITGEGIGIREFVGAGIGLLIGISCLVADGTIEHALTRKIADFLVYPVALSDRTVRKLARAGIWTGIAGLLVVGLLYLITRIAGAELRELFSPVFLPSIIIFAALLAISFAVSFFTRPIRIGNDSQYTKK